MTFQIMVTGSSRRIVRQSHEMFCFSGARNATPGHSYLLGAMPTNALFVILYFLCMRLDALSCHYYNNLRRQMCLGSNFWF